MQTSLTFVNKSLTKKPPNVVLFQENTLAGEGNQPIAWQVIRHCAEGMNRCFSFDSEIQIAAGDSYENFTSPMTASPGKRYHVNSHDFGLRVDRAGDAFSSTQINVRNCLRQGTVNVRAYRSEKLLAQKSMLIPEQYAAFQFEPNLRVFALDMPDIRQGQPLPEGFFDYTVHKISLLGIVRANLIMAGGGAGHRAEAYRFHLEDVERGQASSH